MEFMGHTSLHSIHSFAASNPLCFFLIRRTWDLGSCLTSGLSAHPNNIATGSHIANFTVLLSSLHLSLFLSLSRSLSLSLFLFLSLAFSLSPLSFA